MENITIKAHRIPRTARAATVHVDKGDHTILKVYAKTLKTTLTTALHHLLGVGARCFEENHDQEIKDLEERVRIQAFIIVKYIEKYGQLRAKG